MHAQSVTVKMVVKDKDKVGGYFVEFKCDKNTTGIYLLVHQNLSEIGLKRRHGFSAEDGG